MLQIEGIKLAIDQDEGLLRRKAAAELGKEGRVIVRPSGTEPLLRVMVEGRDEGQIQRIAQEVAKVIQEELS